MQTPLQVEEVSHDEAQRRMRDGRWAYRDDYSTRARYVYYQGSTKTWITLEPLPRNRWKISYYKGCPC